MRDIKHKLGKVLPRDGLEVSDPLVEGIIDEFVAQGATMDALVDIVYEARKKNPESWPLVEKLGRVLAAFVLLLLELEKGAV